MIVVRVLTWNLFHGRAHPQPAGRVLRSEFAGELADTNWDVALLQEAPPRWMDDLCRASGASGVRLLTSRNWGWAVRAAIAERRPDLIKSGEGGSNQVLVRGGWRIAEHRRLRLAYWPERRGMQWLRLSGPGGAELCVSNLHASAHVPRRAAHEVERAARTAIAWSGSAPLVLGGDFNVRPAEDPELFERLRDAYAFSAPTGDKKLDNLLVRGARVTEVAHQLPRTGLSDHARVTAAIEVG